MEATYQQLKDKGLINEETSVLNGILLVEQKVNVQNNKVTIEGYKFRSGDGADGMQVLVEFKAGRWQVTQSGPTWIS